MRALMPWTGMGSLKQEMDRLFDSFWPGTVQGRAQGGFGLAAPEIDIVETDKAFRIAAELPGMDPKDVELSIAEDLLTIKGEKKEEKEESRENYHLSERRFGSFQRAFRVPSGVDRGAISASFEKGVLTS